MKIIQLRTPANCEKSIGGDVIEWGMSPLPPPVRKILDRPGAFAWQTLKAFKANQGLLLAGAVAYYALLSIVPLLILIAIVLSQWIEPEMLLQALER